MIVFSAVLVTLGLATAVLPVTITTIHQHHEGVKRKSLQASVVTVSVDAEVGTPVLTAVA